MTAMTSSEAPTSCAAAEGKTVTMTFTRGRARARRNASSDTRIEVIFGALLALNGATVVGLWMLSLSSGAFGGIAGLFVYQDGNFPVLHLSAELVMGLLAIVSGIALMRRRTWARGLVLFVLGMLAYSSINSAGWPIKNDPGLLVPMLATAGFVVIALPVLLRRTAPPEAD
jgi:hypothetical protein